MEEAYRTCLMKSCHACHASESWAVWMRSMSCLPCQWMASLCLCCCYLDLCIATCGGICDMPCSCINPASSVEAGGVGWLSRHLRDQRLAAYVCMNLFNGWPDCLSRAELPGQSRAGEGHDCGWRTHMGSEMCQQTSSTKACWAVFVPSMAMHAQTGERSCLMGTLSFILRAAVNICRLSSLPDFARM